jgi:DNA-binding NarL/FixJ family response regulator
MPGALLVKPGDVCVLDACLPAAATESLVTSLVERSPEADVLVVSEELSEALVFPLLGLGVRGFLTYVSLRRQFAAARAAVAGGGFWVPRGVLSRFVEALLSTRRVAAASHPSALSRREHDVLEWLLQNLSNKEIGARLNISERTVKFHVSNVLAKFSVQRRADLILKSFQARLVVPRP